MVGLQHAVAQLEGLALSAPSWCGSATGLQAAAMPSYSQRGLSWLPVWFVGSTGDRGVKSGRDSGGWLQ